MSKQVTYTPKEHMHTVSREGDGQVRAGFHTGWAGALPIRVTSELGQHRPRAGRAPLPLAFGSPPASLAVEDSVRVTAT